jgi:hypothetical protein
MKSKLIFGSVVGFASLLLLFTSCTKDMEDLNAKTNDEVAMLNGGCSEATGDYINLISHRQGTTPFFWRGGRTDAPSKVPAANKQLFNGTDFSNTQFMVVTAEGGVPFHSPVSGGIGVNDNYINAGETLILTLSDCLLPEWVMKSFEMTFNGGSNSRGTVEMWCGGEFREKVEYVGRDNPKTPGAGSNNFPVQFIAKDGPFCFSQILIKQTTGRIQFIGYHRNLNLESYYAPTRFHLVPRPEGND